MAEDTFTIQKGTPALVLHMNMKPYPKISEYEFEGHVGRSSKHKIITSKDLFFQNMTMIETYSQWSCIRDIVIDLFPEQKDSFLIFDTVDARGYWLLIVSREYVKRHY